MDENKIIKCVGCGKDFNFAPNDQKFFKKNGFKDPKRCKECRAKKRNEKESTGEVGKALGRCESCEQKTILVAEVGLCGPCCFGEADTINGNW